MLKVRIQTRFKKDLKRAEKRGKNTDLLRGVLALLAEGKTLPEKYRNHSLTGNYSDCRECHIQPDWLLIYRLTENELQLVRLGSHSDLFR